MPITLKNSGVMSFIEKIIISAERFETDGDVKTAEVMKKHAEKMKRAYNKAKEEAKSISESYHGQDRKKLASLAANGAEYFKKHIIGTKNPADFSSGIFCYFSQPQPQLSSRPLQPLQTQPSTASEHVLGQQLRTLQLVQP